MAGAEGRRTRKPKGAHKANGLGDAVGWQGRIHGYRCTRNDVSDKPFEKQFKVLRRGVVGISQKSELRCKKGHMRDILAVRSPTDGTTVQPQLYPTDKLPSVSFSSITLSELSAS